MMVAIAAIALGIDGGRHRRIRRKQRASLFDDVGNRMQAAVVVVAQAARLVIENDAQLRHMILDRQQLVHLLLILHDREADLGVTEHIGHLVRDGVGVDGHRNGAKPLRCEYGPVHGRAVLADHGDGRAAFEAEVAQTRRIGADGFGHLAPCPCVPDTQILMPHRGTVRPHTSVLAQELGERIEHWHLTP
jgi:hypothetical protein